MSPLNPYVERARTRKVLALLAAVPAGDNTAIADRLAGFSERERGIFAMGCHCAPPSDATWAQLVKVVRNRRVIEDVFARISEAS